MAEEITVGAEVKSPSPQKRVRNWLAESLGVSPRKKEEIYLQISRSASLKDLSYWSQVFFSAGIATLGLALNRPAVIIGAMLISPRMGPILASGLALTAGDVVLGTRAAGNLLLSCLIAIVVAVLLVALLPFKEVTSEIASRTQPNTLEPGDRSFLRCSRFASRLQRGERRGDLDSGRSYRGGFDAASMCGGLWHRHSA